MANGFRVVIIGGGVAGMETAMTLGRGRHRNIETTLIDKGAVHYWKPMLHEFAAGTGEESRDCTTFVEASRRFGFRFIQSSLTSVDREKHELRLANDEIVPYDLLVVSLGSRSNDFGISGVMANCTFIDSLPDASAFHENFRKAFKAAAADNRTLEVGVVGGGATGTQLVAELCSAIDQTPGYGKEARRNILRLSLIETGPRILPAFPERVSTDARKQLEALGVSVLTEAMVTSVDEKVFTSGMGALSPQNCESGPQAYAPVPPPSFSKGLKSLAVVRSWSITTCSRASTLRSTRWAIVLESTMLRSLQRRRLPVSRVFIWARLFRRSLRAASPRHLFTATVVPLCRWATIMAGVWSVHRRASVAAFCVDWLQDGCMI